MKRLSIILFCFLFAGIAGCSYPIKDGGDGVYYAESPPVYTYVDGYFGFPYYGPYSWAWYHPVWYSPYNCNHYSWYRSRNYWSQPFDGPAGGIAYKKEPRPDKRYSHIPRQKNKEYRAILPVDLGQMTISSGPQAYSKSQAYRTPSTKRRTASKSSKRSSSRSSGTSTAYRPSLPTRSSNPARQPMPRSVSSKEQ